MPRQQKSIFGLGMLLLAQKILGTGIKHIPPVTLISILIQAALYVGVISPPWDGYEVCLSGESILIYRDYRRLFLSAIEHADDFHLYYNMASFIIKGRTLEWRYGSFKFGILLIVFILSTSGMYVALAKAALMYFDDYKYMKECAIGFSGVLFSLKVLTTFESGERQQLVHGLLVPSKLAVWVELLIIHILVPRASFMGHLAGILVGILYVEGPLRLIIDALHNFLCVTFPHSDESSGGGYQGPSYTYARGTPSQNSGSGPQAYGWNHDIYRGAPPPPPPPQPPPVDAEELRRRRAERFMH